MKKHIFAFAIFFILIGAVTFPLVFKITSYIPGFFSSDENFAPIWDAWRIKFCSADNLSIKSSDLTAYPFGISFYADQSIGHLFFLVNYVLAIFTTPILTYNLQVLANIFLSAFFTYFLVLNITGHRLSAVLSGIIFAFCPYMSTRSWQHLGETYLWMLPLFLWSLLRLRENNNFRVKVIFILSVVFTTFNFDATYYSFVIGLAFLVFLSARLNANKVYIRRIFLLVIIACCALSIQFFPIVRNIIVKKHSIASAHNVYHRPFEDLFIQSARPLSYFLPAVSHPLFGNFTRRFVGSPLYGVSFTEHTLYLGWFPLILAFIAIRRWRKLRRKTNAPLKDSYLGFFILLSLVAWLFSQPPWWEIGPVKIFMPSFFMYKILPMFRAYCRFGVVVMFSVAVLAGCGLRFVLDKFKGKAVRVLISGFFCSLVLFEFWTWPPYKVIDVSKAPSVYYWLKERKDSFVIAEYPLDVDLPNEMYKFYQTFHEHPIVNATVPGTYPNRVARSITKLSDKHTASVLQWLGVEYVLVHRQGYLDKEIISWTEELKRIPKNSGLKLIKNFPPENCPAAIKCIQESGPIDVYEVIAKPQPPKVK